MKKTILIFILSLFALSGCSSYEYEIEEDSHPDPQALANHASEAWPDLDGMMEVEAAEEDHIPVGGIVGEFVTQYNINNAPRANNIALAVTALNNTIVQPGETFSYNDTIGPTNRARGYQKAKVFRNGKETKGYGGGVCQVSTTLFNAAEAAGMKIVERHQHTKEVHYVEQGRDAATSHGSIDFKFANTKPYPVRIAASGNNGNLSVTIYKA